MRRTIKGFLGLVLLVSVSLLLAPAKAHAEPGFNVITSPLPIKINAAPGTTVTNQLRIKNQGLTAEGIQVTLMKFGATGTTGTPDLFSLTPKDTYASWVHFSPQTFVAQPNVWDTVTMTVTIPKNAGLGYYLAVLFSPANIPGLKGATNLKGSVASLVLLNVNSPNEKRSLQVADFSTDHKLYQYLPVNFNVKIHNNGNIYLSPEGNIFIYKGSKMIDTLDFNNDGGSVLPNSNRIFTLPWNDGFPHFTNRLSNGVPVISSHNQVEQTLKWNFADANKFRFGEYTAKLLVVYDNGNVDVPLESQVSFWVIPWKLILVALVLIAIIGFGLYSMIRSLVSGARGRADKHRRARR